MSKGWLHCSRVDKRMKELQKLLKEKDPQSDDVSCIIIPNNLILREGKERDEKENQFRQKYSCV